MNARVLLLMLTILFSPLTLATDLVSEGERIVIAGAATQPRFDGAMEIGADELIAVGHIDSVARLNLLDAMGTLTNLDLSALPGGNRAPGITLSEYDQLGVAVTDGNGISQVPIVIAADPAAKMRPSLSSEELAELVEGLNCEIASVGYGRSRSRSRRVTNSFGERVRERVRRFNVFIHCADRRNFRVSVSVGVDEDGPFIENNTPRAISPNSERKVSGPIAVIPGGAAADLSDGRELAAYIASPDAVPTLVVIDAGADPNDPDPAGSVVQPATSRTSFSSNIDMCASPGRDYAWLSWTDNSNQAVLARYANGGLTLTTLGMSDGPVDLACTPWGEVLVTWVSGQSTVNLALVDSAEQIVRSVSESISAGSGTRSSIAVSHTGAVALAWGPSLFSGSGANLELQRYRLSDFIQTVDLPRGTWINADGSGGDGWFLDLVQRANGDIEMIATYFGYESDAAMPANEAMWLIAQGTIVNGSAQMPVLRTSGGAFNSTANPQNVQLPPWGNARADLLGCNLMRIEVVDADGNNGGFFFLQPAEVLLAGESFCHSIDNPGGTAFESRFPLTWFAPTQSGEGIFFHVLQRASGPPALLAANYTYANDGSGVQLWLFGSAPITQTSVVDIPMFSGRGTGFGANFDTSAATLSAWGTIRVERTACDELVASWDETARFGAGSISMQPLTLANLVEEPCG